MDCFKKYALLAVVYMIFFVVPWFCGFALMWELHHDESSWEQDKYYASLGTKGSLILGIFLFICATEILAFRTKLFLIPVFIEIIIFLVYALGLDVTNDLPALLTIPFCFILKLTYIFWKWCEARMEKAEKRQECV